ncbi:MAG: hypothetical protein ABSB59_31475 [Streptosporangiaceae bacterium]
MPELDGLGESGGDSEPVRTDAEGPGAGGVVCVTWGGFAVACEREV